MKNNNNRIIKSSIIRIFQVLERYSDNKHPLQHQEIAVYLEKEYGIIMERKAIGYNVKLLSEMFAQEGDPIKIITKRKLGTYLEHRYLDDKDVAFLLDLVMSNYSINTEHRKYLYERLSNMGSKTFRENQKKPKDFELIDPIDTDEFAEDKRFCAYDDIKNDIVGRFSQAIKEKCAISFNYDVQGKGAIRYEGYLPIHIGVYNNHYYAYCYNPEKKYTWIRLDYVFDVITLKKIVDFPSIGDFIIAHAGTPKGEIEEKTYRDEIRQVTLVLDSSVKPEKLIKHFGVDVSLNIDKTAKAYIAKLNSDRPMLENFLYDNWKSAIVVEPKEWQKENHQKRLLAYYHKKNKQ